MKVFFADLFLLSGRLFVVGADGKLILFFLRFLIEVFPEFFLKGHLVGLLFLVLLLSFSGLFGDVLEFLLALFKLSFVLLKLIL
jgi:hypothetical protein